ncbi:MAG: sigma-70 family RNA polymerase sigma factor [Verrucomicrobium sp.]|nr:sigma-70 family RNA polymerase sigma factor [Verrucomicrobium sp.]
MSVSSSSQNDLDAADADLVRRAQSGDARAFDSLVTRYRGKVYGMCYHLVQNEQDAWDLAQEAFIKAWRALSSFKGDASFYTWIYRIAHNSTYDWLRKRKIETSGEFNDERQSGVAAGAETVPKGDFRPDEALKNRELGVRIQQAINQLTPDHRTAVLLREVEGLSYEEIAEIMQSSLGTVMSRLFYARKKLQELLKDAYENA